jgi:hypothetical protein
VALETAGESKKSVDMGLSTVADINGGKMKLRNNGHGAVTELFHAFDRAGG